MKTQVWTTQLILTLAMLSLGIGCAKKESIAVPSSDTSVGVTSGTTTDTTSSSVNVGPLAGASGASAWFSYDSFAAFNEYVASNPINNPTNLAVNVNMVNIGSGRYTGTLKIAYMDNGQWRTGTFDTGSGTNQVSYHNIDTGKSVGEFNQWFTSGGKKIFHAFFQDQWGSVILVIDNGIDLGDGGGLTQVSGSVWFKNFPLATATQSSEKCWFIRVGPYDCRTWVVGDWSGDSVIDTTSAIYPNQNGYKKLGSFTGLNKPQAFNE